MQGLIMQDPNDIFFEIKNHTGMITLNRPKALNALNLSMIKKLSRQLEQWKDDPQVKQVMILSSSLKAFCAGGDLKTLYNTYLANNKNIASLTNTLKEFFDEEYKLNAQVKHFSKPYIALLNGISMGGGLGLSIHGSLRIALNNVVLAMPETTIGYFTDAGATYFLSRLEGELGTYVALTSARLNATEALSVGLIDQIIGEPPEENQLHEHQDLVNKCFRHNTIEDILESLLKDHSPFAMKTYNELMQRSPTSLKLTLHILRQAKNSDFDTCMKREYKLALFFLTQPDFFEGIRAAVIDKDKNPKWFPAKLSDVKIDLAKL
jgi:enoyl-CoA hydratase